MLPQPPQQPKYLSALQLLYAGSLSHLQSFGLNLQKHVETRKLLSLIDTTTIAVLRNCIPNRGVPSQLCGGVSSLYCGYTHDSHKVYYGIYFYPIGLDT